MGLEIISEWFSAITQDQVLAYAPIFALIATIGIFSYTQYKKKKVESAQHCFDLNKRMFDEPLRTTRTKIYNAIDLSKNIEILPVDQDVSDSENILIRERDMDEYLNVLEEIGLFVNKKVFDRDFAYEMFGFQIISVHDFKSINDYMKNQRITHDQNDLWSQIEKMYLEMVELKKKKNTIVVRQKFFRKIKKTKSEIDSPSQDKTQQDSESKS